MIMICEEVKVAISPVLFLYKFKLYGHSLSLSFDTNCIITITRSFPELFGVCLRAQRDD